MVELFETKYQARRF